MNRVVVLALLFFLVVSASASERLDSAETLAMLQNIQGRWRSDCRPLDSGAQFGYQQTRLVVSFTHFTFSTVEYANAHCLSERSRWQSKYRFILGAPLLTRDGKEVFAIDFAESEDPSGMSTLHARNIIHYHQGTLLLGLPLAQSSAERLQQLDYAHPFSR